MPKKLLFVLDTLGVGGAEQSVVNMIPELVRRGHSCVVAALAMPDDLAKPLVDAHAEVIVLDRSRRLATPRLPGLALQVSALNRRLGIDIVQAYGYWAPIVVALGKSIDSVPRRILSLQSLDLDRYPPGSVLGTLSRGARLRLLRWAFERRFAVSQAVFDSYERHAPGFATDVSYNSIAEAAFTERTLSTSGREEFRASHGIHSGQPLVVNVGRLIPEKGQRFLIDAVASLRQEGLDCRLVFCGSGVLEADLKHHVCSVGLGEHVRFLGGVGHSDVFKWVQAADVFALPSLTEGLCLALAEAAALGAPAVATHVGGNGEIVVDGETGFLVEPADPVSLARAVRALLENRAQREEFAAKGRARAEARFRPACVAESWESMYEAAAL
jgi:glycosyltransferase involved in cell wall biosynthesis